MHKRNFGRIQISQAKKKKKRREWKGGWLFNKRVVPIASLS